MKRVSAKWNCTLGYSLVQFATWSFYAIVLAFSSNVLYEFGFSDSAISLFLGVFTALSVAVQVAAAELLSRLRRLGVHRVLIVFSLVMLLCAVLLLSDRMPYLIRVGAFGVICMILQTLPSLANSMGMDTIRRGASTDYSFARGMGSLGYSMTALMTGALVRRLGVESVHLLTAGACLVMILAALWYRHAVGDQPEGEDGKTEQEQASFFRRYPRFGVFLLGMAFLCISHGLLCNFMYQIMLSRQGGAMEQGIATSISSLVELPIMFGFPFMLKKLRCDRWVRIAGFSVALKPLLILLAVAPAGVYLAQATQSIGYGLWVIGSVNYAERIVDQGESIRAQSYHGAVTTVSTVAALSMGGVIIQNLGVQTMLLLSLAFSLVGAVIVLFTAEKTK